MLGLKVLLGGPVAYLCAAARRSGKVPGVFCPKVASEAKKSEENNCRVELAIIGCQLCLFIRMCDLFIGLTAY